MLFSEKCNMRARKQEDKKTRKQEDKRTRKQEDKRTRGLENERTRKRENEGTRGRGDERARGHINHRGFKVINPCVSRRFDELHLQLFEWKTPSIATKMKQWGQTPMFHFDPDVSLGAASSGNCSAIASKTLNASLEAIYLKDHARGSKTLAAWSLMKLIVVRRRRTSTLAASCIYLSVSCH